MSTSAQPVQSLDQFVKDDVIEALMEQDGFTRDRSEWAVKVATGVTFAELYKSALGWLRNSRSAPKEDPMQTQTATKSNGHAHAATEKRCKGYQRECAEVLDELNRSGLCKRCYSRKFYQENYAAKPRGKSAPKAPKVARRKALESTPPSLAAARVSLEVTEAQLNQFLVRLPFAEKQRLANHYLATVEE